MQILTVPEGEYPVKRISAETAQRNAAVRLKSLFFFSGTVFLILSVSPVPMPKIILALYIKSNYNID